MSDFPLKEQKIISNAWHQFLIDTTKYDSNHDKPNGWCWFWCLYELYNNSDEFPNLDLATIQSKLHNEHWLKTNNDKIQDTRDIISGHKGLQDLNFFNSGLILLHSLGKANLPISPNIDFSGITFKDDTNFSNLIFPVDTDFSNTTFSKDVFFNNAIFFETADFEKATFQSENSYCKETAKFRNTTFKKIANFRNATFWGYANFKGARLEGRAFFQKAQFEWHAPRFYDATFNNEMTWAGITLPKFAKAKVDRYTKVGKKFKPVTCDECTDCAKCAERARCIKRAKCVRCKALIEQNRRRRIEENQNSYENTAILLEGTKKFHDQHFFFREEMRCRRHLEKNELICLSFWLYEILADYGYGIECAIKAWLWHIFIGAVAISIIASSGGLETWQHLSCSVSVSIANANPFVFVIIKDGSLIDCYECLQDISPLSFGAIRGFQTFIGVTLLFLLLTTLRVRFRLKTTNN